jgi:hypothetical protein
MRLYLHAVCHRVILLAATNACWSEVWSAPGSLLRWCVQVLAPAIPPSAFKAFSTVIRLLNNIVGGMSFVMLAKMFGVQKSSED